MAIAASARAEDPPPANPAVTFETRRTTRHLFCSCTDVQLGPHERVRFRLSGLSKSTRDQEGMLQAAVLAGMHGCSHATRGATTLELSLSRQERHLVDGTVVGFGSWIRDAVLRFESAATCSTQMSEMYIARVTLPTIVVQRAFQTALRACQERTSDADAAVSVVSATRLEMERYLIDNAGFSTNHIASITLSAWVGSCVAANRAHLITKTVISQHLSDVPSEAFGVSGQVVATRTPVVKDDCPLRASVQVIGHDARRIEQDEQARNRREPEVLTSVDRLIGPSIFPATPSIDAHSLAAELSGVQRHLNAGKQLEYREENKKWLEAAEAFMTTHLVDRFGKCHPHDAKMPDKWTSALQDLVKSQCGEDKVRDLKGFCKPREVGLPEDKHARLIGTLGPMVAGENAVFISPLEQAWKESYPGAVTKGATNDELDAIMRMRLDYAIRSRKAVVSCDFSAMDSTWQLHEKQAILRMARAALEALLGGAYAADFDRVMAENDVRCSQERIRWRLKFIDVFVDALEALLFSGERITSLGNRWLVVLLRTSELLRLRGQAIALRYLDCLASGSDESFDLGDGDDTAFLNDGEYIDENDVINAYRGYAKHIEPVFSKDSMEVLSRYTVKVRDGYVHLSKLERNSGRMVYMSLGRAEMGTVSLTPAERAEVATALLFRAYALRHTLVLRYYALALARYYIGGLEDAAPIVVERCGARGEVLASSPVGRHATLRAFYLDVRDVLASSRTSGYSMVRLVHHGKALPDAPTSKRMAWEWQCSDEKLRELEIRDDDFASPQNFIDRMDLLPCVVSALSISPREPRCFVNPGTPERGEVLCPGHAPVRHLEPPPGLKAPDNAFSRPDGRGAQRKHRTDTQSGRGHSGATRPALPKGHGRAQRRGDQRNQGGALDKTDGMATAT